MNLSQYKRMFKCDSARVAKFPGKVFLIIGWKRNTRQDSSQWMRFEDGEYRPFHFDYLDEKVIASGRNATELLKNAREYKRVSHLTAEEYLKELVGAIA